MAAPAVIPILKKVASVVISDKKLRKVAIGIVLGVIFIVIMPILAVIGIFNGTLDIGLDNVNDIIQNYNSTAQVAMTDIQTAMTDDGYSAQRIEEAQALYMLVFFDRGNEDGFVEKFVGCFELEQTDEELISTINQTFGTNVSTQEYTDAIQEIRDKYKEQEKTESG